MSRLLVCLALGLCAAGAAYAWGLERGEGVPARDPANRLPVRQGKKWGYIDRAGRLTIPCTFDAAEEFDEGVAPVKVGQRWGLIDESGQFLVRPTFAEAFQFVGGLASVRVPSRLPLHCVGAIDRRGRYVVPAVYDRVTPDGEVICVAAGGTTLSGGWSVDSREGFLGREGNVIVAPRFVETGRFREGLAAVSVAQGSGDSRACHWGYISLKGEMVIPPQFEEAKEFSEGLAAVAVTATSTSASDASDPFEDAFSDGVHGCIDHSGRLVISPRFSEAWPFENGYALVELRGEPRARWVGRDGTLRDSIPDEPDGPLVEGLRASSRGRQWGYRDAHGAWRIPPTYDRAGAFEGGYALVARNFQYGWIDRDGKVVIALSLAAAKPFVGAVALASPKVVDYTPGFGRTPDGKCWDGPRMPIYRWGLLDRHGTWVVEPCFEGGSKTGDMTEVDFRGSPGYVSRDGTFVRVPEGFEKVMRFARGRWVRRR